MAKPQSLDKLVSSAAARANVEISKEDLSGIRACRSDSRLAKWIEGNLRGEGFLSSEEVRIAGVCEGGGGGVGDGDTGVVPLREEDLLQKIAELEAETEVLMRQAGVLEGMRGRGEGRARRGSVFARQIQERDVVAGRLLEGEILEAKEEVEGFLRMNGESVGRVVRAIPAQVTELLNGHDRVLEGVAQGDLAGVGSELAASVSIETVEGLTAMLSRMVAEELQVRLDRIYLESLHEGLNNDNDDDDDRGMGDGDGAGPQSSEEVVALEQDLESLYAEIPDVAAMYVAQKYSEPLHRAVREEERQRRAVAAARSQKVTRLLAALTLELEQLAERLRTFHSWRCAMQDLREGYEQFCISDRQDGLACAKATKSPPRGFGPAVERMMRHFGITATASKDLREVLDEKVARLRENARRQGLNTGVDARKVLDGRKVLVGSLLNGIDHDQEGLDCLSKLDALEARISRLREDVEVVGSADMSQAVRRQKEFVERWSSVEN